MCGPSETPEVTTGRVEVDKIPVSIHLIVFPLQIRRTDWDPFESTTRRQLANLREKVNDLRRENQMRSTSLEMALSRLEGSEETLSSYVRLGINSKNLSET